MSINSISTIQPQPYPPEFSSSSLQSWSHQKLLMSQQKQLLLLQLTQIKQRYSHLKRQQTILFQVKLNTSHQQNSYSNSNSSPHCNCNNNSLNSIIPTEDNSKQINILTDYITLKEKMFNERVRGLEEEVKEKDRRIERLEEERRELEGKLEKCLEAFKESEEYYIGEVSRIKEEYQRNQSQRLRQIQRQRQQHQQQQTQRQASKPSKLLSISSIQIQNPLKSLDQNLQYKPILIKLQPKSRSKSPISYRHSKQNQHPYDKQNENEPILSYRLKISRNNKQRRESEIGTNNNRGKLSVGLVEENERTEEKQERGDKPSKRFDLDVNFLKKRSVSPLTRTINKPRRPF